MQVKRVKFERTGGFAGIRVAADLNMDDLPGDQAKSITELLDDLDFQDLPQHLTNDSGMPDQFTYTITVETDKGEHTVVTGDVSAPKKMQELIQQLNRLARTYKKQ